MACRGPVLRGAVGYGVAGMARPGKVRHGSVRRGRQGVSGSGQVWLGMARQAWQERYGISNSREN